MIQPCSTCGQLFGRKNQPTPFPQILKYEWAHKEVNSISSGLALRYRFGGMSYKKKYINVIGPTGVGKTTTLAKMAAEAVIEKRMKIAFITTDTYRIAAIEQLKTYAGLLNVPVEVVYKMDDFQKAIEKFQRL